MQTLLAALALALLPASLAAHGYTAGALAIGHPHAFETAASAKTGGGYLTITNTGSGDDALIGVRGNFARAMLHRSVEKDGVVSMTHVERIEIPAGATVELAPGGYHVMFMGLKDGPLAAGTRFDAVLVFEKAGEVPVAFSVEERGSTVHSGH